ncbi:hypothetical protein K8I61_13810, partial [bacterium]|nr:hypothetical protein [bacterium]
MTIVPIEDRRQELRGLAAALLVLAITWAFHLIGFGDYEIGSLPDIIDQFDLRAAGDPQWGYIGLGYVDVKFGWLHARLHAIPYALGVPLWGLVALQAAGHLLAVLIFWRGLRGHVPEDLRAVSVMALAAEPLPVLMIAENSTALFILAPVIFVAWRWARTPSAAWPHAAAAGLLFALAIHLHFIALFVLPAVYADLFFGRQRSLASTIAFSAAWILAGFVPAANGGLDDLAQLLRGTAEQSGEKPYELWALGFVALAGVHVMATAGSIILLRCRPMHETRLLRDA